MKFRKINVSKLFSKDENPSRSAFFRNNSENGIHFKANAGACKKNDCSCMASSDGGRCSCKREVNGEGFKSAGENASGYERCDGVSSPSCRDKLSGGYTGESTQIRDKGNEPIVFDIRREAFMTPDFRTAIWTGANLQLTVMTVPVGGEIGVEKHDGLDQLIGIISGAGEVTFGNRENYMAAPIPLDAHSVVLVPAGTYHNVKNVGKTPLKLYSVYAPKAHKFGTVEKTKE